MILMMFNKGFASVVGEAPVRNLSFCSAAENSMDEAFGGLEVRDAAVILPTRMSFLGMTVQLAVFAPRPAPF